MITVTVWRKDGEIRGIESQGHAGFAEEGRDIICAAVSVLLVTAVNSIDNFTEDIIHVRSEEGYLSLEFIEEPSEPSKLLMNSLLLGLSQIQDSYDRKYLRLLVKEV